MSPWAASFDAHIKEILARKEREEADYLRYAVESWSHYGGFRFMRCETFAEAVKRQRKLNSPGRFAVLIDTRPDP